MNHKDTSQPFALGTDSVLGLPNVHWLIAHKSQAIDEHLCEMIRAEGEKVRSHITREVNRIIADNAENRRRIISAIRVEQTKSNGFRWPKANDRVLQIKSLIRHLAATTHDESLLAMSKKVFHATAANGKGFPSARSLYLYCCRQAKEFFALVSIARIRGMN